MDANRLRQIIQTRITPPKAPKNIIARSGIVELLSKSEDKKLLLLVAPAGFGKTTITAEFSKVTGKPVAWLQVTPDMQSVFDFIVYLSGSLRRVNPQFGRSLLLTLEMAENDSQKIGDHNALISELAGIMINEMHSSFEEKLLIVLDDLHELQSNINVFGFLDMLIRDLPENIQFLISSRQFPKLSLAHLRAKRQIKEITEKELMFKNEEVISLAETVYSIPLSEKSVHNLQTSLGGWITGLHLVMQSLDKNKAENDDQLKMMPANLFDYFAEEIFNRLDGDIKDFLLKTSHLENFEADSCNQILQIENGSFFLDILLDKNIFLESKHFINANGKEVTNYNYIQLFKTFLSVKSLEILDEKLRNELLIRSALYYKTINEFDKAIDYSILSKDHKNTELLIKDIFQEYFLNGRFEKLWQWVSSLNEDQLLLKKEILYYKGILYKFYHGDQDRSLDYINRSIALTDKDKDEDFIIEATISRLGILLNQGNTQAALKELLELEKKKTSGMNKAKVYYYLAYVYFFNNDFEPSLRYANSALELCNAAEYNTVTEDIYNLLGNLNIIRGEFVLSIHYYELTLDITKSLQRKLVVLGNLGILYSRSGKYQLARDYYEQALKLVRYFTSPIFELLIKMTEYTLLFETGDYLPAASLAAEINRISLKLKNNHYIYLSYQFLGECSYYLGKNETAGNYFKHAEKYVNSSAESDTILNSLLFTINNLETAPASETEEALNRINQFLSSIDSSYDKTIAQFFTARFYFNTGSHDTAYEYLDRVFALSKEKGYFSFLLREYIRSNDIFNISKKKFTETLGDFLASIHEIAVLEWISNDHKENLIKLIDMQYDLKMNAFGGLRFILHGEEIPEKKWIRKNRKLLLCYLMLAGNSSLSKDKIIDVFYGDTPLESADNSFHQAISNLRTALRSQPQTKTAAAEAKDHDYIIYQDKTLRLNGEYFYYTDLEDFDSLIKKSGNAKDDSSRAEYLIKAADLYTGDVLEGYYEPWCESLREEYRNKFVSSSEKLLLLLSSQNRSDELITYSEKLIQLDSLNYAAYKELIRTFIKLGKESAARNKINKFIAAYEEEMSEKPPQKTLNELNDLFKT